VDASHDLAQGAHTRRVDEAHLGEVEHHRVLTDGCGQLDAHFTSGGGIEVAPQAEHSCVLIRLGHNAT